MNNDKIEVSRELAESLMNGTESMGWSLAEELRALLAAAPYQCLDGGKCGNGGYCDACPHTKPSAQLQSDQVAIGYIQGIGERFIGKAEYDPRNGYVIPIYAAPPELAELQAELSRYKSLFDQAQKALDRVNALHTKRMATTLKELQATIAQLTAENERLKGGQGEPVAWINMATGYVTTSPVVVMDWDDEKEPVQSLYRHPAEQSAPAAKGDD